MRKAIKYIVISMIVASSAFMFTGCGGDKDELLSKSKEELVQLVRNYETEKETAESRIIQLEDTLQGLQVDVKVTPAISSFPDGTGRTTFNSIGDRIVFPREFIYPNSTPESPDNLVQIASNITIKPQSNWTIRLEGSNIYLNHVNGTVGQINIANVEEGIAAAELKNGVILPFLEGFPTGMQDKGNLLEEQIFIDSQIGVGATTGTYVNQKEATFKCGIAAVNGKAITYMFLYDTARDSSKEESIKSLLESLAVGGKQLKITTNR